MLKEKENSAYSDLIIVHCIYQIITGYPTNVHNQSFERVKQINCIFEIQKPALFVLTKCF